MFNLFGKSRDEAMVKVVVVTGLEYYKHLSEWAAQEIQETAVSKEFAVLPE